MRKRDFVAGKIKREGIFIFLGKEENYIRWGFVLRLSKIRREGRLLSLAFLCLALSGNKKTEVV